MQLQHDQTANCYKSSYFTNINMELNTYSKSYFDSSNKTAIQNGTASDILKEEILEIRSTYLLSHKVLDDKLISKRKNFSSTNFVKLEEVDLENFKHCEFEMHRQTTSFREMLEETRSLQACDVKHMGHAAEYLEFFYSLRLTETLLVENLTLAIEKLNNWLMMKPQEFKKSSILSLENSFKDLNESVEFWKFKVSQLNFQSSGIVPCHLRLVNKMKDPVWCYALADYTAEVNGKHVKIAKNKNMKLIDTSSNEFWIVEIDSLSVQLPPSVVMIPPPCMDAVTAAKNLKVSFYNLLSQLFQLTCKVIFWVVILCFKTKDKILLEHLKTLSVMQRSEFQTVCDKFKVLYSWCWTEHSGYQLAVSKLDFVTDYLKNNSATPSSALVSTNEDNFFFHSLTNFMKILVLSGQLHETWRTVGIEEEILRSQHHLLVFKDLVDYKQISQDELSKLWQLAIQEDLKLETWEDPYIVVENTYLSTDAEYLKKSSQEEYTQFSINGVFDTLTNKHLSVEEAIRMAIIDKNMTHYIDRKTFKKMTIHEALMKQHLVVEALTEKRIVKQEEKSYGVITIHTKKSSRPYIIKEVWDPKSKAWINSQTAMESHILDTTRGFYYGEKPMLLLDAVAVGHVRVSYFDVDDENVNSQEEITQSFTVVGVVNQETRSVITFTEAVNLGILDPETGEYHNGVDGERVPASEAIKRGFLKVKQLKNPGKLDQNPELRKVDLNINKVRLAVLNKGEGEKKKGCCSSRLSKNRSPTRP